MDTISELAAAGFFFAAGLLAAVTAPDWIIGAAVGVCLLLVGTVLFQKGMKQLIQEMQTRRTEEREQMTKQFEKLQTALDELQASEEKRLGAMCSEVADLHTTAKDASEKAQEAAGDIMRALDDQKDDQRRNIEKLCGKLDNTEKDICAKLNSQQTELQACRTKEREQTAKQLEVLQTALGELQALEKKGLEAVCNEVADLHTTAKDASEKAQEAAGDIMRALDDQKDDQRRNIEKLCGKLDNTEKDICAKLNSQQTELQACRTKEREQTAKQLEVLQTALDELRTSEEKYLGAMYNEIADLNDAAKNVCEEALEGVENTMQMLDDKEEDRCKDIKDVCKKLDDAAKDICEKLSSQQTELQTFLKAENEANRKSMEQIMKNYSDVTEQDVKVLTALGEEVRHG